MGDVHPSGVAAGPSAAHRSAQDLHERWRHAGERLRRLSPELWLAVMHGAEAALYALTDDEEAIPLQ